MSGEGVRPESITVYARWTTWKGRGSLLKPNVTVCFKMEEDIDMQAEEWTPLNRDGRFHINFDGNNHTISNLKCTQGKFLSFFDS